MLRTVLLGHDDYVTVYGGEAVHSRGDVVGRLRSCAYGYTVRRTVALAYLPSDLGVGDRVEVEVFGERVPAEVAEDVLVDPDGKRIRG
jgi:dimethylglycine oxidase